MTYFLRSVIRREFALRVQSPAAWLYAVVFFVMVLLLFPLAMGANGALLHQIGVAAVWIAALLAILLGMDGLFRADIDEGTLEQVIVARHSVALWALLKVTMHWLTGGFVLTLLSFLSIPLFGLSLAEAGLLALTLMLGTPILTLFAAVAAALTVTLRGGSVFVPLIALPLQLPVLIFATGVLDILQRGGDVLPILALLAAGLILSLLILPFVLAAALRLAL